MATLLKTTGNVSVYASDILTGDRDDSVIAGDFARYPTSYVKIFGIPIPLSSYRGRALITSLETSVIRDGHKFNGKVLSKTGAPAEAESYRVRYILFPEMSELVSGRSAFVIDVLLDVYKLLGGRSVVSTLPNLGWIKGKTTKLGMQLTAGPVEFFGSSGPGYLQYDFSNVMEDLSKPVGDLHQFLYSYASVDDHTTILGNICQELATVIYTDAVLDWNPTSPATIKRDIHTWLVSLLEIKDDYDL